MNKFKEFEKLREMSDHLIKMIEGNKTGLYNNDTVLRRGLILRNYLNDLLEI